MHFLRGISNIAPEKAESFREMEVGKLPGRVLGLSGDNNGTGKNLWQVIKWSAMIILDEFAQLKRGQKEGDAILSTAGQCHSIKRQKQRWFPQRGHENSEEAATYAEPRNESEELMQTLNAALGEVSQVN